MTSLEQHLAAHQLGQRIDNNTLVCQCGDFVRDMPGTYDDPYREHRAHVAASWQEARTVRTVEELDALHREPSGISDKLPVTSDVLVRAREALDARGHPIMDGHGHVRPRIDGQRARCGGPRICKKCQAEAANMADPWQLVADLAAEVENGRARLEGRTI